MNLLSEMAPQLCKHQDCIFNGLCQVTKTVDGVVHQGDCEYQKKLRAALSAARDRGWVLVPVEPDEAMVKGALSRCKLALGANVAREMLKTVISAAPSIEGDG